MNLPRPLRKLINPRETAVLKKDFREIWNSAGVRALLILLPLVFAGVIPIVFIVLSNLLPAQSFAGMDQLRALLGEAQSGMNDRQALFYLFSDCLGPMFFLLIPLLVSCIAAATSFLGERQHGTMETLFLTPLTTREIFKAKVIGCLVLSVLATLIAFLLFTVIMIVGDIQLGVTFFLANASWWVLLLLVAGVDSIRRAVYGGFECARDRRGGVHADLRLRRAAVYFAVCRAVFGPFPAAKRRLSGHRRGHLGD